MLNATENRDGSFRVWVASYEDFNPTRWSDVPTQGRCHRTGRAALYDLS